VHETVADRRRDWVEKITTRIAAKARLNKGIYANCWGMFARRLGQKMQASGTTLIEVPARFGSQECRKCGHTAKENRESQAVFLCIACGHGNHADHNAAAIVLARARPAPTPGPGATPHGALAKVRTKVGRRERPSRNPGPSGPGGGQAGSRLLMMAGS
jgi:putative transposase